MKYILTILLFSFLITSCTKESKVSLSRGKAMPVSYILQTPPVILQTNGECVAIATSQARTIEYYYSSHAKSFTTIFSPAFIYNQTKVNSNCGSGTYFTSTLDLLRSKGVCTISSMPFTGDCSVFPNIFQVTEAAKYKIASYNKIANNDNAGIKKLLLANHPVMSYVSINQSFYDLTATDIWKDSTYTVGFPHCLLLVGYDDTKHAYKCMNSWGTEWADKGFCYVDYDFFPAPTSYYLYAINI